MSCPASIIRVRILTSATATAAYLLGTSPSRIFHLTTPQTTTLRPYMVYGRIGGAPAHHLVGAGGLMQERVQLECYCDKVADLETLSEIVRTTCDAFRGTVTVDSTTYTVRRLHLVDSVESVIWTDSAKPLPVYSFTKEFELDTSQSIPTY